MSSTPTYYDLFGVARTASADQIRSAYLWLMKQHHPDRADSANRERAADYAAALNRCYDVLKDPLKRQRYDAYLATGRRGRIKGRSAQRVLLTGARPAPRRSRWDRSTTGAALLTGLVVALAGAVLLLPSISGPDGGGAAHLGVDAANGSPAVENAADVRLAMRATPPEAQFASQRCFAGATHEGSLASAQRCVLFDDAYLVWNQTPDDELARPNYFREPALRARHDRALRPFLGRPDARLASLRNVATTALLAETRKEVRTRGAAADGAERQRPDDQR